LILGPAGSGKTFRCLSEIRRALAESPDGPPLLLIAPKQTTYQLERQLLAGPEIGGYTRLHILSFERLAVFVFNQLGKRLPPLLDEEGRVMVLRGLLARKRDQLKLFRASARLTGFAQHLSLALRELQRQQMTPESLAELASCAGLGGGLASKLTDLAMLLGDYLAWLRTKELEDAEHLLDLASETLRGRASTPLKLGDVWVDGFTEFAPQEVSLLADLLPHANAATLTFCLDAIPTEKVSWLAHWSVARQAFHRCRERLAALPDCEISTELLPRRKDGGRFAGSPVLAHLEANWAELKELVVADAALKSALRVGLCVNPEAEVTLAAHEILRFVRAGGRYREITVLARRLDDYHALLANVFARCEIPWFLDRRESVSHHPLAELTRNALRTVASSWQTEDWFAALKTGLVPAAEGDIDRLENEALARGWNGRMWQQPLAQPDDPELQAALENVRRQIVPPFNHLALALGRHGNRPNGQQLAEALAEFWRSLKVEDTLRAWTDESSVPNPIHLTVWDQMEAWLENLKRAFPGEALSLREWLPILEAGLAGLTVGVIPPALDQVLIGAIDRSRNPDIRLAIVLGMNETVFPALPEPSVLLTDSDRVELDRRGVPLVNLRQQLGRERFYCYTACTRARERLVLTCAAEDGEGHALNPSPFLAPFKRLFPALEFERIPRTPDWRDSEHASELVAPLLRNRLDAGKMLAAWPALASLREQLKRLAPVSPLERLPAEIAARLYGPDLRTSVSRMEQFAACPFKFFVHSGLRAEERKLFELDIRNQGTFQHEVLASFHEQLTAENLRWRDLTPAGARERIRAIAGAMAVSFRDGLLQASEESRFTARMLTDSLADFVETLTGWMRSQYAFDPAAVELSFGELTDAFPPWPVDLGNGHRLLLKGRIDRVDLWRSPPGTADDGEALCVVVDYKSSQKQLDPVLLAHGLQLQLPAYLNVLRHWPEPGPVFGVARLKPAGVFYVNLRGKFKRGRNRDEALAATDSARNLAYQHTGRFDARHLRRLDTRADATKGDQFKYGINQDGKISGTSREALESASFLALLDTVEQHLQRMGRAIYAGEAAVDPYRKGATLACDQCEYAAICRIDPWTHVYRALRPIKD
jgi:ATP-dependent helicase/nuclease subunit B